MADSKHDDRLALGDELYERYAKPLEREHWGEYIVIAPNGEYEFGPDQIEVVDRALARFGKGGFMFRIGPRVMGSIRDLRSR